MTKLGFCLPLHALLLFSLTSHAQEKPAYAQDVERTLRAFQQSDAAAAAVMDAPLTKTTVRGAPTTARATIAGKDAVRKKLNSQLAAPKGRAGFEGNDEVENLVDVSSRQIERSIVDMDESLRSAKLKVNPWSDTYWPLYRGTTAQRYLDPGFTGLSDKWTVRFGYFEKASDEKIAVDQLSPAEKYDLLVGDTGKTLTKLQWQQGANYNAQYSKLEDWSWMGLCHGWAPAAFQLDRPVNAVKVKAVDGETEITFYPSDIKALATLLWSNYSYDAKFLGGRCNVKDPKKTAAGRVEEQECFDSNPGTWHMTVVNQIGKAKRSFVIDATYDMEVWNQPVLGYEYSYFNPVTGESTNSLEKAMADYADFAKKDKFAKFRDSKVEKIVGIAMELSYIVETEPSAAKTDSPEADAIQKVRYMYDLELTADGKIIGGEWYTNLHPDFLWNPAKDERAVSPADRFLKGEWDAAAEAFPESWSRPALRASQGEQPLAAAVEALIKAAQSKQQRR